MRWTCRPASTPCSATSSGTRPGASRGIRSSTRSGARSPTSTRTWSTCTSTTSGASSPSSDRADRLRTVRGVGYTLRAAHDRGSAARRCTRRDRPRRAASRTRRRLFLVTLGLVALLVVGHRGGRRAIVTLRALDDSVDQRLAGERRCARLDAVHDGLPSPTEESDRTARRRSSHYVGHVRAGARRRAGQSWSRTHPGSASCPACPTRRAGPGREGSPTGRDIRTVDAGGDPVRLLTVAVSPRKRRASRLGFVQGGFAPHPARPSSRRASSPRSSLLLGARRSARGRDRHAHRDRPGADPDPTQLRRAAPLRRRRVARAANAGRAHPRQCRRRSSARAS